MVNANNMIGNLIGLQLGGSEANNTRPLKLFRQEVLATIDKTHRKLSGAQLLDSPLTVIKGIGLVTQQQLQETLRIETVADLANINVETRWTQIARNIKRLAQKEAQQSNKGV